jgi:hypothetical protein
VRIGTKTLEVSWLCADFARSQSVRLCGLRAGRGIQSPEYHACVSDKVHPEDHSAVDGLRQATLEIAMRDALRLLRAARPRIVRQ